MTDRIKDLMTEAGISIEYVTNTKQIVILEKFAELIIDECIQVVHAAERKPEGFLYAKGDHILKTEIYNHFGVKE